MRNRLSDLRGVSRLAVAATAGVTRLVEEVQTHVVRRPARLGGPIVADAVSGISGLVFLGIQGVTQVVGDGIDVALAQLAPRLGDLESSPRREAVVAALNGVLGDHLADTGNPLAIPMRIRRAGRPLELTRAGLRAGVPAPSGKILVLVHGLCMNDLQWRQRGHDHGAALARALGWTPVYLHYNTGRHVSRNGRELAPMLQALVDEWPVPVEELAIVGHSMGGLVARSAHHYGTAAGDAWPRRLSKLVFLGTPHHGAPLERGGQWLHRLLETTPYTAPFTLLGKIRSAGITDLRHGSLLDEDWLGRDRFGHGRDPRRPVPLPRGVRCFAIAATTARWSRGLGGRFGDGLVPLASALGRHRDPRFALEFPEGRRWIARGTGHFELLHRPDVYRRIETWLAT